MVCWLRPLPSTFSDRAKRALILYRKSRELRSDAAVAGSVGLSVGSLPD